jgi:hypothetical protein
MRLQFTPQDSIYKIFKTIRKIPNYKEVRIFIDPKHTFFENPRRGKEIKETIEKKQLNAQFVVQDFATKRYFEDIGIPILFEQYTPMMRFLWQCHDLIFATKDFHNNLFVKQNYVSYLVFGAELAVIFWLLYIFWGLLSPNATITITPQYTIKPLIYTYRYYPHATGLPETGRKFLALPYYTGAIPFEHEMTINVQNINFVTTQAKGEVIIYNTLAEPLSLIANSKLIGPDDILFTTDTSVEVPGWSTALPGTARVQVTALSARENGEPIGEEGNIAKHTRLLIKNLPTSNETEEIFAEASMAFVGWSTEAQGTVLAEDIEKIEEKITDYVQEKRKEILQSTFTQRDGYILLFDDLITVDIQEFITTSHEGEKTAFIDGKLKGNIDFFFVKWADLLQGITTYIAQRPSEELFHIIPDPNSVTFFTYTHNEAYDFLVIPTKVDLIYNYNFSRDGNGVLQEIREKIAWLATNEALRILMDYPEIGTAKIRISPSWYTTLPSLWAKIRFKFPELPE